MEPNQPTQPAEYLQLPVLAFGPMEIRRLSRELEALEDYLHQNTIRQAGVQAAMPKTSRLLDALATNNGLNLLMPAHRERLTIFLRNLDAKAPILHISFAVDPSSAFTAKIVTWLRSNVHPYMLVQLGLQPTITAGCVVRLNSKAFDFSLRERFKAQRNELAKALAQQAVKV